MLRDDIARYTELSGEDGEHTSIQKIGAYLDGYDEGYKQGKKDRGRPVRIVEPKIYGNEHNCIMTMFGECSYSETGCGSCEVVAKVFEALKDECPPVEPERPKGAWREYPLRAGRVELECSECGDTFIRSYGYIPHFCEHCGADMRGDKECH